MNASPRIRHGYDTLIELFDQRHSCRGFLPTPLQRTTIAQVLAAAQRTASWCNAQPWQVHIVSGAALERLRADLVARAEADTPAAPDVAWPREYRGVYQSRRRECGWDLYRAVGVQKGDREGSARQARENFRLFGAPHLAIVSSAEPLGAHGVMDCGGWVANFMLAATSLGVATIAQAALASWPDVLRAHLGIPEDRIVLCGISFGHEDPDHPANAFRTDRAPLDEVVTWIA
jgi:nitroreductase